jgi:hypothetical protein
MLDAYLGSADFGERDPNVISHRLYGLREIIGHRDILAGIW